MGQSDVDLGASTQAAEAVAERAEAAGDRSGAMLASCAGPLEPNVRR